MCPTTRSTRTSGTTISRGPSVAASRTHPAAATCGTLRTLDAGPWQEGIEIESNDGIIPSNVQLKHAHTIWEIMNELLDAVNVNQDDGPANLNTSGAAQGNTSTATNKQNKKKRGAKGNRFKGVGR